MDVEIKNFIKIWIMAITSMIYCYYFISKIPRSGTIFIITRLILVIPIIYLFITLPLSLTSFHLGGPTIFYLVWLANFKLILFAFNQPPLSSPSNQPLSLLHFISIALLPIKAKQGPVLKTEHSKKYALKALMLGIIISIYQSRQYLNQYVVLALYCCHVYLGVELVLLITAKPVEAILGLETEPQFNEPYLATSLQDFWGYRWNLMVTSILRPTVYIPVKGICTGAFGRRLGTMLAILATFLVSGLMHEVIYYYFTRVLPTWEVTWFFVVHGVCTAIEVAVKKGLKGKWRLHRVVSGALTVAFVAVTGVWLFLPQIIRNGVDRKAINEYYILLNFFRDRLSR